MSNDSAISKDHPDIFVLNVRPSPKDGPTVAYADVKVGPVISFGFSIVRNKWGGFFVGFPVRFGNDRTFPLIEIDEPCRGQVIKMVLSAADKFTKP